MRYCLSALAVLAVLVPHGASAQARYSERPPLVVSPDLSAPWVLQLQRPPAGHQRMQRHQRQQPGLPQGYAVRVAPSPAVQQRVAVPVAVAAPRGKALPATPQMNPKYLPQEVAYDGPHKPGNIVIDTHDNFLYLIGKDGRAMRYGVGTGKPGFEWAGSHKVTRKAEWPDWRPPAEMIAREKKKGRILPVHMKGGIENPMGARALYLGSTLYRIHGTNQPWTIGGAVSSGCIRMRNEDVIDLYQRVPVGATVIVI